MCMCVCVYRVYLLCIILEKCIYGACLYLYFVIDLNLYDIYLWVKFVSPCHPDGFTAAADFDWWCVCACAWQRVTKECQLCIYMRAIVNFSTSQIIHKRSCLHAQLQTFTHTSHILISLNKGFFLNIRRKKLRYIYK